MICLTVKAGKRLFLIGPNFQFEFLFTRADRGRAGLSIKVPDDVQVLREEVLERARAAQQQAAPPASAP